MTTELKPCPMCGSNAEIVSGTMIPFMCQCKNPCCQLQGRVSGNKEKSILAWNTRTIPKDHAAVEKDLLADGGVAQKAFWHAFEQAKCNDNMNIRNSWEEYKIMLNKTGDK